MASVLQQIGAVTAMNVRTIPDRLGISLVIVAGIAGVVGVLVAMLAMATGFEKTLGYSDRTVLVLVLVESLILCGFAAAIGMGLAAWLAPGIGNGLPIPGFAGMKLTTDAWMLGGAIAAGLALVVGLPPALRAMRLDIVNALSGH